jgi:hypothetical protein
MSALYILIAVFVSIGIYMLLNSNGSPVQRGGFSDDLDRYLSDPPNPFHINNNEHYLEALAAKIAQPPVPPAPSSSGFYPTTAPGVSQSFQAGPLQATGQPSALTDAEKQYLEKIASSVSTSNNIVKQSEAIKQNILTTVHNTPTESDQQNQILAALSESQKHIDIIKLAMDRSKNMLMDLSSKLQTTDFSTASKINKMIKCPTCPLTTPGIMNYSDISAYKYKSS